MLDNPSYGALDNMAIAAFVLVVVLLLVRFTRGFVSNISVLLGMAAGCVVAIAFGKMNFAKVGAAHWFDVVTPFAFGMPTFDPVMVLTIAVVMIVVMIESTGMFLALSDMTGKKIGQAELAAGLRTDGLGTVIGGIFNTFPHTSFSQNVGLVAVTGVKSRWVCVAGGVIMIVLGTLPKMAAFVEAIPLFVLGGAGLVMFGIVAATGIRILLTGGLQGESVQPLHRRPVDRIRPDPAGGTALVAAASPQPASAARVGNPAHRAGGGGAEPVLQRWQGRRRRDHRRGQLPKPTDPPPTGDTRMKTRLKALAALAVIAAVGHVSSAAAATWSDNFIGYRFGTRFHEPSNPNDVQKHVLQFTHSSGYSIGQNFLNLDILQSDDKDPANGSTNGATEFYATYRHQIHLGKAFDKNLAFGPVKEVALTLGVDLNTKNTRFAPRKRLLLIGPTLKFDLPVPGFFDLSLLAGKEWNHCGLGAPACPRSDIAFDPQLVLSLVWGIPFQAGAVPLKFQGFLNYNTERETTMPVSRPRRKP